MAACCCICQFPVFPCCNQCFLLHFDEDCGADSGDHIKVPLAAYYIDEKATIDTLRKLNLAQIQAKDISERVKSLQETYKLRYESLLALLQENYEEITRKFEEISSAIDTALAATADKMICSLAAAEVEVPLLSDYLATVLSDITAFQIERDAWSHHILREFRSVLAVNVPKYQLFERINSVSLSFSLPPNRSLGVLTLNAEILIKDIKPIIATKTGISQFDLFLKEMLLNPEETLQSYQISQFAEVMVCPLVTIRAEKEREKVYISGNDTAISLKIALQSKGWTITESHYLVAYDQVLSDESLPLTASSDLILDLKVYERLQNLLILRDEMGTLYEIPVVPSGEESIGELKRRIASIITYDEDCQRLIYRSKPLSDDAYLSAFDIHGGSLLILHRLTTIYAEVPDIPTTPYTKLNTEATVLALKLEIAKQFLGLPPAHQCIRYQGRQLADDYNLSNTYRSNITVSLSIQGYLLATYHRNEYIAVEYLDGREPVAALRKRLGEKLGMQGREVKLGYKGRELRNAENLASAGVQEGSLLNVFL